MDGMDSICVEILRCICSNHRHTYIGGFSVSQEISVELDGPVLFLSQLFQHLPSNIGFNIEVKYPSPTVVGSLFYIVPLVHSGW